MLIYTRKILVAPQVRVIRAIACAPVTNRVGICDAGKVFSGTGRRKAAVAHAMVTVRKRKHRAEDHPAFTINGKAPYEYFHRNSWLSEAVAPVAWTGALTQLHVECVVRGGGMGGQAGAVRLAVSRALCNWDHGLHGWLKGAGCLSRDRRVVERKKTGRKPVPLFVVDVCACIYLFTSWGIRRANLAIPVISYDFLRIPF